MFGFFVALFGGLYYGGKLLGETAQDKVLKWEYDAQRAEKDARQRAVVPDESVEKEIEQLASTPEGLAEVADDLIWAYHNDPNVISLYGRDLIPHAREHARSHSWWIYLLLMSKRGFMPFNYYVFGLRVHKSNSDAEVRMAQRIEQNLQQFHPWFILYTSQDCKDKESFYTCLNVEDYFFGYNKYRPW